VNYSVIIFISLGTRNLTHYYGEKFEIIT